MRPTFLIFSASIIALLCTPSLSCACSCAEPAGLDDAFSTATSVFSGRVTSIRKSALRKGQNEIQFSIMKAYKGAILDDNLDQIMIYTPDSEERCQYDFQREQDYLVFASGNPAYLKVEKCGRTGQIESVMADIDALDKKTGK